MVPDWKKCKELATNSNPDLFLFVHYLVSCQIAESDHFAMKEKL